MDTHNDATAAKSKSSIQKMINVIGNKAPAPPKNVDILLIKSEPINH